MIIPFKLQVQKQLITVEWKHWKNMVEKLAIATPIPFLFQYWKHRDSFWFDYIEHEFSDCSASVDFLPFSIGETNYFYNYGKFIILL